MAILENQMVFLVGHRGGVSHKLRSVVLALSVAHNADELESGKSESLTLAIPADHAEKMISSIQQSLATLRGSN